MSFAQIELITKNRQPHEEKAGVRYSVLDGAVADFKAKMKRLFELEEHVSNCTCEAARPAFRIPTERDTPAYRAMEQARIDRLLFGEA